MFDRKNFNSLYPPSKNISELSIIRYVIFGFVIVGITTFFFSSAMVYIGLYAGMGIAIFFPTIIISMIIIKLFKGNAREAHFAGVVASAAGDIAIAIVVTLPVFIILGIWTAIDVSIMIPIYILSGLLGVIFATVLRKTIIDNTDLKFPESVAVSSILSSFFHEPINKKTFFSSSFIWFIYGAIISLIVTILTKVYNIIGSTAFFVKDFSINGKTTNLTAGVAYSPALIGIGWIIGPVITSIIFIGAIVSWFIINPIVLYIEGIPSPNLSSEITDSLALGNGDLEFGNQLWGSFEIWGSYTRYITVGIILVLVIYLLIKFSYSLFKNIKEILGKFSSIDKSDWRDFDIPKFVILILFIIFFSNLVFLINVITGSFGLSLLVMVFIGLFGLLIVAITGFFSGIIGSSNVPISLFSFVILILLSLIVLSLNLAPIEAMTLLVLSSVIIVSMSLVSSSLFQNMATARIIGASPLTIQIGTIFGLSIGVIPSILMVFNLDKTYAIGSIHMPAIDAFYISGFINGIYSNSDLIFPYIFLGIIIGIFLCILDFIFKKHIVFAFAIGMYLPITISTVIFAGGIFRYITKRFFSNRYNEKTMISSDWELSIKQKDLNLFDRVNQKSLLFSSGLIVGEAIIGILLAFMIIAA